MKNFRKTELYRITVEGNAHALAEALAELPEGSYVTELETEAVYQIMSGDIIKYIYSVTAELKENK